MLQTEKDTRSVEKSIRSAFRNWSHRRFFNTVFEHGQWWVLVETDDETQTYSVCDANTVSGFDFERV